MKLKLLLASVLFAACLFLLPSSISGNTDKLLFSAVPSLDGLKMLEQMEKQTSQLAVEVAQINRNLENLKQATLQTKKQLETMRDVLEQMKTQKGRLSKAIALLDKVRRQTRYTRHLVEQTLSFTKAIEKETKNNLTTSLSLKLSLLKAQKTIGQLRQEIEVAEKLFQSINQKLPRNLPL